MRMHPIHRGAIAFVVAVLPALGACTQAPEAVANGDDPLAALHVSAQSSRYTTEYWLGQVRTNPDRWRQAVDYCRTPGIVADGGKPNCGFVQLAANQLQVDSLRTRGIRMESASKQIDRNMWTPKP